MQQPSAITLQEELETCEAIVIKKDELPLNSEELASLVFLTSENSLHYDKSEKGDTDELASVKCSRVSLPNEKKYNSPEIMAILQTEKFISFLKSITGMDKLEIDRVQSHVYGKDDFLAFHNDQDSTPRYQYTVVMYLSENFEGGEFLIQFGDEIREFTPDKFSMLILKSHLPHAVKKVSKGERKVLVFFLQESGS